MTEDMVLGGLPEKHAAVLEVMRPGETLPASDIARRMRSMGHRVSGHDVGRLMTGLRQMGMVKAGPTIAGGKVSWWALPDDDKEGGRVA